MPDSVKMFVVMPVVGVGLRREKPDAESENRALHITPAVLTSANNLRQRRHSQSSWSRAISCIATTSPQRAVISST